MKNILLLSFLLLFTAGLNAAESVDKTLPADMNGRVSIEHHSGKAVIRTWDKPQVKVTGTLDSRAKGFIFETRGNEIRIEVEMPRNYQNGSNWLNWDKEEDNLEIFLPADSFVEYENINAELDAKDIRGGVDLSSVNGDIRVTDLQGRIRISTVNGDIRSQDLNGNINLNTVNGDIKDRDSRGEEIVYESVNGDIRADTQIPRVKLETVNADSELKMGRVEQLKASNVNGDTSVRLELAEGGEVKASSVSGRLELRFQKEVSARFDIEGHAGGDLRNKLTDDKQGKAKYGPSRWLKFSTKEGSGRVNVSTVSGTVVLSSY
ncbi:DUF4097 family beta strand repeat-containing protein [Lacimicrobium alkaliphilum]|uniref:DUF4097 domain-containing protein n=1 Tax=Lacimicrobium alkaliphilum TaxID=1526571 RepID=A0A0U2ZEZ2_9ALTE|nr:DUF4097 family beta strand repeat-containing protein [Lacimicrobium alkaliphilum]ALS97703.1 hypothetical protein AT746_05060 [Lacimicrobium alkaliphilum]